jgi:hypothetical protein
LKKQTYDATKFKKSDALRLFPLCREIGKIKKYNVQKASKIKLDAFFINFFEVENATCQKRK